MAGEGDALTGGDLYAVSFLRFGLCFVLKNKPLLE